MLVKLNALQCDHPEHRASTTARWLGVGATSSLLLMRRQAARRGWARRVTSTRHEYDLCPEHAEQLPGVDFGNWKAERRGR